MGPYLMWGTHHLNQARSLTFGWWTTIAGKIEHPHKKSKISTGSVKWYISILWIISFTLLSYSSNISMEYLVNNIWMAQILHSPRQYAVSDIHAHPWRQRYSGSMPITLSFSFFCSKGRAWSLSNPFINCVVLLWFRYHLIKGNLSCDGNFYRWNRTKYGIFIGSQNRMRYVIYS